MTARTHRHRGRGASLLATLGLITVSSTSALASTAVAAPPAQSAYVVPPADGQKWPTDEALRASMSAIREAYDRLGPYIENWTAGPHDMNELGNHIDEYVNAIIANTHLPTPAQENLDYLIADLQRGAQLMHGTDPHGTPYDGAAVLKTAFSAYGKYFDDPNWSVK